MEAAAVGQRRAARRLRVYQRGAAYRVPLPKRCGAPLPMRCSAPLPLFGLASMRPWRQQLRAQLRVKGGGGEEGFLLILVACQEPPPTEHSPVVVKWPCFVL